MGSHWRKGRGQYTTRFKSFEVHSPNQKNNRLPPFGCCVCCFYLRVRRSKQIMRHLCCCASSTPFVGALLLLNLCCHSDSRGACCHLESTWTMFLLVECTHTCALYESWLHMPTSVSQCRLVHVLSFRVYGHFLGGSVLLLSCAKLRQTLFSTKGLFKEKERTVLRVLIYLNGGNSWVCQVFQSLLSLIYIVHIYFAVPYTVPVVGDVAQSSSTFHFLKDKEVWVLSAKMKHLSEDRKRQIAHLSGFSFYLQVLVFWKAIRFASL